MPSVAVMPSFDPGEDLFFSILMVVKTALVYGFNHSCFEEAFGYGVALAVSFSADDSEHLSILQDLTVRIESILDAPVGVEDQTFTRWAVIYSHSEGCKRSI